MMLFNSLSPSVYNNNYYIFSKYSIVIDGWNCNNLFKFILYNLIENRNEITLIIIL